MALLHSKLVRFSVVTIKFNWSVVWEKTRNKLISEFANTFIRVSAER